jgi:hypothetical protein
MLFICWNYYYDFYYFYYHCLWPWQTAAVIIATHGGMVSLAQPEEHGKNPAKWPERICKINRRT